MEEKLKLLTQSAKVIEQLKTQLDSAKNEKSKLVKEKDEALRGKNHESSFKISSSQIFEKLELKFWNHFLKPHFVVDVKVNGPTEWKWTIERPQSGRPRVNDITANNGPHTKTG